MQIERVRIDALKPYKNNAKIHTPEQIDQIVASIQEFGFNDPIAIDEGGMVIEGHGRLLALQEMGETEVDAIRLTGLTDEQKAAYVHVHNQLTLNTGFDLEILEQELRNITTIDMGAFGFDLDFDIELHPEDFDDAETVSTSGGSAEHRCERGQIWQLGQHRLMCGDSTDAGDVDLLTGGRPMDLCVTDPTYNVALGSDYGGNVDRARELHRRTDGLTIMNDNMEDDDFHDFLLRFYDQMLRALKPGGAFYIFHASSESFNFISALREAGGLLKQTLIWVKNSMALGRQDYQWKHEPCLYGWKDGGSHYFTKDRCQTTVFENRPDLESMDREQLLRTAKLLLAALDQANTSTIHENKPTRSELHPTMKPVPLVQRLVQNSSRRGEAVLDLFGGSGSTIMACEACGRVCYTMELDPKYCDAILHRWEEETGRKAELING